MVSSVTVNKNPSAADCSGNDLQNAIDRNDIESTIRALNQGTLWKDPLPYGHLPIVYAIRHLRYEIVAKMLDLHPIDLSLKDLQGLSALDHAVIGGDSKMKALVISAAVGKAYEKSAEEAGIGNSSCFNEISAEVEPLQKPDIVNASDFQRAAFSGDLTWMQQSINNHDLNQTDVNGWTPLHYACIGGQVKAVEWLLKKGVNTDLVTKDLKSPLHFAAIAGNPHVIELLLSSTKINPNGSDSKGRAPLHYAAVHENLKSASLLIKTGADPINRNLEATPLSILMHGIHKRANERDPLKLDTISVLMCSAIVGSWICHFCGENEVAKDLRWIASLGAIPLAFKNAKHWTDPLKIFGQFVVIDFVLDIDLVNISQMMVVVSNAFKGLNACFSNCRLEIFRPNLYAFVHIVNGADSLYRCFESHLQHSDRKSESRRAKFDEQWRRQKANQNSGGKQGPFTFIQSDTTDYKNTWNTPCKPDDTTCMITNGQKFHVISTDECSLVPNARSVLGLTESTADKYKKNYRTLSLKFHPDKFCNENKTATCETAQKVTTVLGSAKAILEKLASDEICV